MNKAIHSSVLLKTSRENQRETKCSIIEQLVKLKDVCTMDYQYGHKIQVFKDCLRIGGDVHKKVHDRNKM